MSIELGYIYSRGYIFGMEVMHQIYKRGACDIIDHIRVSPMRLHILQNYVSFLYISCANTNEPIHGKFILVYTAINHVLIKLLACFG